MMKLLLLSIVFFALMASISAQQGATPQSAFARIQTAYDRGKNTTTVRLEPIEISGERDEYYSLQIAASFEYAGRTPSTPEFLEFEIRTIVKGRKLNVDLYIVFLVDGESIFLSSNRRAVKNPVPGRRMIGERIVMRMPYETFSKIVDAKQVIIRMGGTRFALKDDHQRGLGNLKERMKV